MERTADNLKSSSTGDAATAAMPMGRRIARIIGWTSITLGLLILGFVVHQVFITDWFAARHQNVLEDEVAARFATVSPDAVAVAPGASLDDLLPLAQPDGQTPSGTFVPSTDDSLTYLRESAPEVGAAAGIIRIPGLKIRSGDPLEWTFVEGVTLSVLTSGAGHMPGTVMPGQVGNAVISGHRTTHGGVFYNLDELGLGDRIEVETAIGLHVYEVRETRIVQPTELWVTRDPGSDADFWTEKDGAWLTLTTCNPQFSAKERLIIFAELVEGPNADVILSLS